MKVDWIKKISSRKFWLAIIGFVSALLVAFHVGESDIAQVSAIISAFGTLVIYILSESAVDKASVASNQTTKTTTTVLSKDLNAEVK